MTALLEGELVFDGVADWRSIVDGQPDFLVFDPESTFVSTLLEPEKSLVVFDAEPQVATLTIPGDFLLIDSQPTPRTVDAATNAEVFVIDSVGGPGPAGQPGGSGPSGPAGPAGPPGTPGTGAYFQEFGFASPSTTWTLAHNQNSLALNVEVVDSNGDPIEGNVRFLDVNTTQIDWYYPTTGLARVFR